MATQQPDRPFLTTMRRRMRGWPWAHSVAAAATAGIAWCAPIRATAPSTGHTRMIVEVEASRSPFTGTTYGIAVRLIRR